METPEFAALKRNKAEVEIPFVDMRLRSLRRGHIRLVGHGDRQTGAPVEYAY